MKFYLRKAFTMIELMIVIVVIGILAAIITYSASEFIATAKARVIVTNMHTIKKALLSWYATHRNMVVVNSNNYMVKYGNTLYPIQELWEERDGRSGYISAEDIANAQEKGIIGTKNVGAKNFLARYMENSGNIKVSGVDDAKGTFDDKNKFFSPIVDEGYMIHDNDTKSYSANKGATNRTAWYVGYSIPETSQGERIKAKLAGMAKSNGLLQDNIKHAGSSNLYTDARQVWMMIIDFEP